MELHSEAGYAEQNGERVSTSIYVPKKETELNSYIKFRERKSKETIQFNASSVVLTEKMAETLGVKSGEPFILENADGKTAKFIVSAVTENYVGCYVYVNEADYIKAFGGKPTYNMLVIKSKITDTVKQDEAVAEILKSDYSVGS